MLGGLPGRSIMTWQSLLLPDAKASAPSAVIVIAPSGSGKSTELERQCERLCAGGFFAFRCEAGAVATDGLRESLDPSSAKRLDSWRSGTSPAVLFLDAADEIYLRQRRFRDVTRRLAKELDFATREIQVVVTARTGLWSPNDRNDLADLLRSRIPEPRVDVVTLEPVDTTAVAALARAGGVRSAEEFLRRFDEEELYDLIDLRPCDVQLFVDYWNKHGTFGTWTQILDDFLDTAFAERNAVHQPHQALSLEQGSAALRRIAAASVLTKKPHITLPTSPSVPGALDGRKLFADWQGRLLGELFGNGLFVHKGEAAVQLPQGALTHFLTADWFGERFRLGWNLDDLRDALFVRVFEEHRWRVPASRLPIVGWVASEVPEIRKLVLDAEPHALLYEGDPRKLDSTEILGAIRKVIELAAADEGATWPTTGTIRQLARPELSDAILALLREYRGVAVVEQQLLRYVEIGRYRNCVSVALEICRDRTADESSRAAAISAVASVGNAAEKASLLELASDPSAEVRAELVSALVPDLLKGDPLIQFLLRVDDHRLRFYVGRAVDGVALADVDATLTALLPSLQSSDITTETESHFELAAILLGSRLRRDNHVPAWLADIAIALEKHWAHHFVSDTDRSPISDAVAANAGARRAIWAARIRSGNGSAFELSMARPHLARLHAEDLAWMFEQYEAAGTEALRGELRWAMDAFFHFAGQSEREEALARVDVPPPLKARFREIETTANEAKVAAQAQEHARSAAEYETRNKNIENLTPRRAVLESGTDINLLVQGWQHLVRPDSSRARIDLGQLRKFVGDDFTESFARGFKACWRLQQVPVPEPGTMGALHTILAGLTGLTLEIRDGRDLVMLNAGEAELAARYALYESNAFPYWFDALRAAHPVSVRNVLEDVLSREWRSTLDHSGVMRFAPYAARDVGLLMRTIILGLAEQEGPGHAKTARMAANALLLSNDDTERVARTARDLLQSAMAEETEARFAWLRVWAHVAPVDAADWLMDLRDRSADAFKLLVEGTADQLENDFDSQARIPPTALLSPKALERWVKLLHLAVPPDNDLSRSRDYNRGPRSHAEDFRRRCLSALAGDPSLEAYLALRRLRADDALSDFAKLLARAADAQIANATEVAATPWTETDVVSVERGDERKPSSREDLFRLVSRHLRRVGQLVENDDFSYRSLFTSRTSEPEVQRWTASSLKLVARGLYSVIRESVVDDDKEVDISAVADGIGRIPIEIKPLGPYSLNALTACIRDQLYGRYMQPPDVTHGILLLVRQTSKRWEVGDRTVEFPELVDAVRAFADAFAAERDKVIAVITIDLLKIGTDRSGAHVE